MNSRIYVLLTEPRVLLRGHSIQSEKLSGTTRRFHSLRSRAVMPAMDHA